MTTIPQPRRSCRYCGSDLASDADYRKAVCSRSCSLRAYRVRQRESKALQKDPDARRRCRVCDKEIVNVRELRSDASYCSGACRTTAYRDRKTGNALPSLTARPDVRPLPVPLRPANHETLASYLRRLANANDVPDHDLLQHLQNSRGRHRSVDVDRLAAATGRPTRVLRLALPELRNVYERSLAVRSGCEVDLVVLQIRPACRRCTAAHAGGQVECWQAPEINLCMRHRLWIGNGVGNPARQLDISWLPEILSAQRRHLNLLRRHGRRQVTLAHSEAWQICLRWQERRDHQQRIRHRMRAFAMDGLPDDADLPHLVHAAIYPELVALTSLLAADYWRLLAGSADDDERHQFRREVSRRIGQSYRFRGTDDPMERWMFEQRRTTIGSRTI